MEDIQETISSTKHKHNVKGQNSADREIAGDPATINQLKVIKKELKVERKKTRALKKKINIL